MTGRWGVRILGALLLIIFFLLMLNLEKQLLVLQKNRKGPSTQTTR
jgi:hypothetical protein